MLPKENRLRGSQSFKKIAKAGQPIHSPCFILKKLAVANQKAPSRFGLVVSVKVSKKSTIRNQLKRRIREIIRHNLEKIKGGFIVMLIVKNQAVAKKYQEIKEDLEKLFKKAQLL
jgi:ribonuclease P protein component